MKPNWSKICPVLYTDPDLYTVPHVHTYFLPIVLRNAQAYFKG